MRETDFPKHLWQERRTIVVVVSVIAAVVVVVVGFRLKSHDRFLPRCRSVFRAAGRISVSIRRLSLAAVGLFAASHAALVVGQFQLLHSQNMHVRRGQAGIVRRVDGPRNGPR